MLIKCKLVVLNRRCPANELRDFVAMNSVLLLNCMNALRLTVRRTWLNSTYDESTIW